MGIGLEYIKEIAFFMVFSGILLELTADTKYHKFSEWVVGLLLILKLVKPWMEGEPVWEQFLYRFASFEYALGVDEVTEQLFSAEEAVGRSVQSAYEETLNAQIEHLLHNSRLTLVAASYEFEERTGELKQMAITAVYQMSREEAEEEGQIQIRPIEKVVVGEREEQQPEVITPMELYIKNMLADFYQLSADNINVSIRENLDGR